MPSRHNYPDRKAALGDLDVRDLKVNADVHCERDWPAKGTWSQYDGRVGRVVAINLQTLAPPSTEVYVELGVRFTNSKTEMTTWFLPAELRRGYGAFKAPRSHAMGARAR